MPEHERSLGAWRKESGLIAILDEQERIEFGATYNVLAIGLLDIGGDDSGAVAGDLSSTMRLTLTKRLNLATRLRYRHSFTEISPSNLGNEAGLLWRVTEGFSDAGLQIPDFHLENLSFNDALRVRYGQFSPDGLLDQHFYGNVKEFFINQAFSSSPAVGFPSFGAGVVARWDSPKGFDVTVAASTLQGTPSNDGVNWQIVAGDEVEGNTLFLFSLRGGFQF